MFGAPVTVTPPVNDLILIEDAKSFLRIDSDAFDIEVELLVGAAVDDLQDMSGVRLLNQTIEVSADGFEDLTLFRVGPVRAVVSISYRDRDGDDQAVSGDAYELSGALFEQGVRPLASWPVAQSGSIVVRLDVGFGVNATDVPKKYRYAAFALLRGKFEDQPVDVGQLLANSRFFA